MARPLVFSNDELHVGLNNKGLVSTVYFPHVGLESHTPNTVHRIGVWVDGRTHWLGEDGWTRKSRYLYNALIGHTVLVNEEIGILLEFEDFVDSSQNAFIRNIHVVNLRENQRNIRLFMHQAFVIGNNYSPDTAQFMPKDNAVLHYEGRRAFVASGQTDVGQSADQHSVGLFGNGRDGTWRDADDGELSNSSSSCGRVDSTLRFSLTIGGLSSRRVHYWLTAGNSIRVATQLHRDIQKHGVYKSFETTANWWRKWLTPGLRVGERLEPAYRQPFAESMMRIRAQFDRRGAVISCSDRLGEAYFRPRQAAYSIWPLIRLGYTDEVIRFFTFCRHSMSEDGYLLSMYRPDGAVGDSRHSYDEEYPPISSDATAIVVFIFAQFHSMNKRAKGIDDFYKGMIVPMANFLSRFTDDRGLPRASFDFTNSFRETNTYTTALTYAALISAADLADANHDQDNSVKWRATAEDMRHASSSILVGEEHPLVRAPGDSRSDIPSLFGVFMYGLIDFNSDTVKDAVIKVEESYRRHDGLFSNKSDKSNVDTVSSLWMAQYYLEAGRSDDSKTILDKIFTTIDSDDEYPESTTWGYAEFVSSLLDTLTRK